MSRITQAHPWMSVEELKALLKRTNDRRTAQKALVVINVALQPCLAKDIAVRVGVAKQTVHNWMSVYNRFGPEKLFDNKPRKPSENLLTEEEERSFMEPFIQWAATGQIATAKQIKRAFEEVLGFEVHHSTIYRLLDRHEWRRIKPLSNHPKKDKEAQEDFKKNSGNHSWHYCPKGPGGLPPGGFTNPG